MKVSVLNPYSLNPQSFNKKQTEKKQMADLKALSNPIVGYEQYAMYFGMSQIPKNPLITSLKRTIDVPCMLCSKKMIPGSIFESINWSQEPQMRTVESFLTSLKINKKFPIASNSSMEELIKRNSRSKNPDLPHILKALNPDEVEVLKKLINECQKTSNTSMDKILNKLGLSYSENIKKLVYKNLTPLEYSQKTINTLKKFEEYMFPTEKEVFEEIKAYQSKNPEAALHEILIGLRQKHLKILIPAQFDIFNQIDVLAENLPKKHRIKILEATENARQNAESTFRRTDFIETIKYLLSDVAKSNKKTANRILRKATEIPNSAHKQYGASAFIVKHSEKRLVKTPQKEFQEIQETPKKFEDNLLATEKVILEKMRALYSKKYPNKTNEELMQITLSENYEKLSLHLKSLIMQINSNICRNSEVINAKTSEATNYIRKIIAEESLDDFSTKKLLLEKIKVLKNYFDEKNYETILKIANKMPCSSVDSDAFIVKYYDFLVKQKTNADVFDFAKALTSSEKIVFEKVKNCYLKPNSNRNLQCDYPIILSSFIQKQNDVLNEIDARVQSNLKSLEQYALKITNNYDKGNLNDLKSIIDKIKQLYMPLRASISGEILRPLSDVPTSKNDISAFVVKYANFEKSQFKQEETLLIPRSDKEIGRALLERAVTSEDHINAQKNWSPWDSKKHDVSNIGLVHKGCNGEKNDKKLKEIAEGNPELATNVQNQLDFISNRSNASTDYLPYIKGVTGTIVTESEGLIKPNANSSKV